jgi:hypothetical protein
MEIEILQENHLRKWCSRLLIPDECTNVLSSIAEKINTDEELQQTFTSFYDHTVIQGNWHQEWSDLPMDPLIIQKMGHQDASLFYLLAYLSALPGAERKYRQLGIGLDIFYDTMRDITLWINHAHEIYGDWRFTQFSWIWRHLDCQLFRLGRLQFMLSTFPGNVTAFRNKKSGRVILFGDPKMTLRNDGYAEGAGGNPSNTDTWNAVYEESPAGWRGNRIMPQGYTLREQSFLIRSEWTKALKFGDTILDLHIPRGEKLSMENCKDSFIQAFKFFTTIFPDHPFKGVYCHTWFFTPQLQTILPQDSNIVHFQREFYLYPHPGGPAFLWSFVFGEKYPEAKTAPRDTSLRNAVLNWINNGGELFDMPGIMLHSPELWGTQPYYPTEVVNNPITLYQPIEEPKSDEFEDEEDEEEFP